MRRDDLLKRYLLKPGPKPPGPSPRDRFPSLPRLGDKPRPKPTHLRRP